MFAEKYADVLSSKYIKFYTLLEEISSSNSIYLLNMPFRFSYLGKNIEVKYDDGYNDSIEITVGKDSAKFWYDAECRFIDSSTNAICIRMV